MLNTNTFSRIYFTGYFEKCNFAARIYIEKCNFRGLFYIEKCNLE